MNTNEIKKAKCCCTTLSKCELVKNVTLLESQLIFANNSLENAQRVILKLRNEHEN